MRCAVVSDIHANLEALEAVLADAGDVDHVWCLGDIVDMGPQPNECLDLLRARDAVCIYGNHEEWVSGSVPSRLQGTHLDAWACWTKERVTPDNHAFLDGLPELVAVGDFSLLHFPHPGFEPPAVDDLVRFTSRFASLDIRTFCWSAAFESGAAGQTSVQISRALPDETVLPRFGARDNQYRFGRQVIL